MKCFHAAIRHAAIPLACLLLSGCAGIGILSPPNGGFTATDGSVTARVSIQGGACPGSFEAMLDGVVVTQAFSPQPPASTTQASFTGLATGNHLLIVRVRAGSNCQAYMRKSAFYHAASSTIYLTDGENSQVRNDRVVQIADMSGSGWTAYGGPGTGSGQFTFPRAIAAYPVNRIYVTDQANHRVIQMHGMTGAGWTSLGTLGYGPGHFYEPTGIAVDGSERLYVSDATTNQIVRFDDMSGAGWISFGSSGSGVGQFLIPTGIALDRTRRIYVADGGNSRIVRINNMSGAGWTSFGSNGSGVGQFGTLAAVALDASGRIYAADTGNCRVVRINDMSGAGWMAFGSNGNGVGQFGCSAGQMLGIHVDGAGQIYVTDLGNSRLVRIDDMTGEGWTTLGSYGSGSKQFVGPNGVFVQPPAQVIAP